MYDWFRRQAETREQKYVEQAKEKPQDGENPSSILLIIKIKCPTEKEREYNKNDFPIWNNQYEIMITSKGLLSAEYNPLFFIPRPP